jgi:hypothetical protein
MKEEADRKRAQTLLKKMNQILIISISIILKVFISKKIPTGNTKIQKLAVILNIMIYVKDSLNLKL